MERERPNFYRGTGGELHQVEFVDGRCVDSVVSVEKGLDGLTRRVVTPFAVSPDTPQMQASRVRYYADERAIDEQLDRPEVPYWRKWGYDTRDDALSGRNRR